MSRLHGKCLPAVCPVNIPALMKRKEILKTDKPRYKLRLRPAVYVLRCVILFDHTAVHNSYLI